MTDRSNRSWNIVQGIRTYRTLHSLGRPLHAGAQVTVTCNAVHLSQLTFCAQQSLARGLDGLLCFSAYLRLRSTAGRRTHFPAYLRRNLRLWFARALFDRVGPCGSRSNCIEPAQPLVVDTENGN